MTKEEIDMMLFDKDKAKELHDKFFADILSSPANIRFNEDSTAYFDEEPINKKIYDTLDANDKQKADTSKDGIQA